MKCSDYSDDQIMRALQHNLGNITLTANELEVPRTTLSDRVRNMETLSEAVRLSRQAQKAQDTNRIKNKTWREIARIDNAVEEYVKELQSSLLSVDLTQYTQYHPHLLPPPAEGVIHWSDLHFNEIVADVVGNEYDFKVASKRLRLHVQNAVGIFKLHNIKDVFVCMTGDLLNSDRRLDELLSNAANRSKATLLSVILLEQALLELNREGFNIFVASVSGNESRVGKDRGWIDELATDNYDFMIHEILSLIFRNCEGISFIGGDPTEKLLDVAGQTLLMLHGDNALGKHPTSGIEQAVGRWSKKGISVDYAICGHFHQAFVSDNFSRSSSMVGSNAYSDKALNLSGRASQNVYVFFENGNRNAYMIDLQNIGDIEGYDINESLAAYNAKSAAKLHKKTVIHEVVV